MNLDEANPKVSVLMTVRNVEKYISSTLRSILQERNVSLEVVLVDNGCTDSTISRVKALNDDRVRIIEGPRKGPVPALNMAFKAARGQIIMSCDGDDLYPKGRIKKQVEWLAQNPDFGAVCGGFSTVDDRGNLLAELNYQDFSQEITTELQNGITRTHICTFAIRASIVKATGYLREYFDCSGDIDFQLRLGETCRIWYIPEIFFCYRLHQNSVTHSMPNTLRVFYDTISLEFQRQRREYGQDQLQQGCPPPVPQTFSELDKGMCAAEHVQSMLMASAWTEHNRGCKRKAIVFGIRSVLSRPLSLVGWKSIIALVIKPSG